MRFYSTFAGAAIVAVAGSNVYGCQGKNGGTRGATEEVPTVNAQISGQGATDPNGTNGGSNEIDTEESQGEGDDTIEEEEASEEEDPKTPTVDSMVAIAKLAELIKHAKTDGYLDASNNVLGGNLISVDPAVLAKWRARSAAGVNTNGGVNRNGGGTTNGGVPAIGGGTTNGEVTTPVVKDLGFPIFPANPAADPAVAAEILKLLTEKNIITGVPTIGGVNPVPKDDELTQDDINAIIAAQLAEEKVKTSGDPIAVTNGEPVPQVDGLLKPLDLSTLVIAPTPANVDPVVTNLPVTPFVVQPENENKNAVAPSAGIFKDLDFTNLLAEFNTAKTPVERPSDVTRNVNPMDEKEHEDEEPESIKAEDETNDTVEVLSQEKKNELFGELYAKFRELYGEINHAAPDAALKAFLNGLCKSQRVAVSEWAATTNPDWKKLWRPYLEKADDCEKRKPETDKIDIRNIRGYITKTMMPVVGESLQAVEQAIINEIAAKAEAKKQKAKLKLEKRLTKEFGKPDDLMLAAFSEYMRIYSLDENADMKVKQRLYNNVWSYLADMGRGVIGKWGTGNGAQPEKNTRAACIVAAKWYCADEENVKKFSKDYASICTNEEKMFLGFREAVKNAEYEIGIREENK